MRRAAAAHWTSRLSTDSLDSQLQTSGTDMHGTCSSSSSSSTNTACANTAGTAATHTQTRRQTIRGRTNTQDRRQRDTRTAVSSKATPSVQQSACAYNTARRDGTDTTFAPYVSHSLQPALHSCPPTFQQQPLHSPATNATITTGWDAAVRAAVSRLQLLPYLLPSLSAHISASCRIPAAVGRRAA